MSILKSVFVVFLAASLNGCVIAVNTEDWKEDGWLSRQHKNAEQVNQLVLGATLESVRLSLGEPDFTEAFVRNERDYQVLYYRTRHLEHDGKTTKAETTPLVFNDGLLVGWGDSAVAHAAVD